MPVTPRTDFTLVLVSDRVPTVTPYFRDAAVDDVGSDVLMVCCIAEAMLRDG